MFNGMCIQQLIKMAATSEVFDCLAYINEVYIYETS